MPGINTGSINEERLRLGIDGLRSGRFKKGIGNLHKIAGNEPGPEDEHCCLGGLSIIAAENGCPVARTIIGTGGLRREMFGTQESEFLSEEVREWFGFDTNNPVLITPGGGTTTATHWNDQGLVGTMELPRPDADFGPIADGFERTYLNRTT